MIPRSATSTLDADFLEINRGPRVVILQSDVSGIGPRAAHRLVPLLSLRDLLIADELVHRFAVQHDHGLLALENDVHRVPFARRLLTLFSDLAERIERTGGVPLIAG